MGALIGSLALVGCGEHSVIGQRAVPSAQSACNSAAIMLTLLDVDPALSEQTRGFLLDRGLSILADAKKAEQADGLYKDLAAAALKVPAGQSSDSTKVDRAPIEDFLKVCADHEIKARTS